MLEKFIERKLVKEVEARGGLCMKFVSPGLVGVPDRIIITNHGRVIFAELKTDKGHVSDRQSYMLQMLRSRGVETRVVYGMSGVKELLRDIDVFDEWYATYEGEKDTILTDAGKRMRNALLEKYKSEGLVLSQREKGVLAEKKDIEVSTLKTQDFLYDFEKFKQDVRVCCCEFPYEQEEGEG